MDSELLRNLSDNIYTQATELIIELCELIEKEEGQKPTIQDLSGLLYWGIRSTYKDILSDIDCNNLQEMKPILKKKKRKKLMPGDLFAIPAINKKYFLSVYIKSNRFGLAYGIFDGLYSMRFPSKSWKPKSSMKPIYSGAEYAIVGKWKDLGNYPDLLKYFPNNPEIYHYKKFHLDNDSIGEFGSAEDSDGNLRKISKAEAEEVGLLDGSYDQCMLEEQLEEYLRKKWGEKKNG